MSLLGLRSWDPLVADGDPAHGLAVGTAPGAGAGPAVGSDAAAGGPTRERNARPDARGGGALEAAT